jgi:hypothetical protein
MSTRNQPAAEAGVECPSDLLKGNVATAGQVLAAVNTAAVEVTGGGKKGCPAGAAELSTPVRPCGGQGDFG